jgi:hypothetical protein
LGARSIDATHGDAGSLDEILMRGPQLLTLV